MTIDEYRLSAFAEYRMASKTPVLDAVFRYELDSALFGNEVAAGGTVAHVPLLTAIRAAVSTGGTDRATVQSHRYLRAGVGQGLRCGFHALMSDAGQANQIRQLGLFDDASGAFFRLDGTDLKVVTRSSVSGSLAETALLRAVWNVDQLNGQGTSINPSGELLDVTKANLYEVRVQGGGGGTVDFFINGHHVHRYVPSTDDNPFLFDSLPARFEVLNSGVSVAGSLTVLGVGAWVESEVVSLEHGFGRQSLRTMNGTDLPMLSIRPSATFKSQTNRVQVLPHLLVVGGPSAGICKLVLNGTLTGASWASADAEAAVDVDSAATVISGGRVVGEFPLSSGYLTVDLEPWFGPGGLMLGLRYPALTADILSVVCNAASGDARASLSWSEVR